MNAYKMRWIFARYDHHVFSYNAKNDLLSVYSGAIHQLHKSFSYKDGLVEPIPPLKHYSSSERLAVRDIKI